MHFLNELYEAFDGLVDDYGMAHQGRSGVEVWKCGACRHVSGPSRKTWFGVCAGVAAVLRPHNASEHASPESLSRARWGGLILSCMPRMRAGGLDRLMPH
eukprot:270746-Chlamydomonas_euryale.AAC.12